MSYLPEEIERTVDGYVICPATLHIVFRDDSIYQVQACITCPFCGQTHKHSVTMPEIEGDGYRIPHCKTSKKESAYYIVVLPLETARVRRLLQTTRTWVPVRNTVLCPEPRRA